MPINAKRKSFGAKGGNVTVAEQLLSGPGAQRTNSAPPPRLKPRPRARFGRKSDATRSRQGRWRPPLEIRRWGWKAWAVAVMLSVLALEGFLGLMDWPSPTLGGRQLWTDVRVQGGWRVQCHAWTGHCRLLDGDDMRRTWGDEKKVLAAMDAAIAAGSVAPAGAQAVVLVHGLGRSAHSFDRLAADLRKRGLNVVAFNYASTQGPITEHARALNRVVAGLSGVEKVSFVTHSLGGLVLRQALNENAPWRTQKTLGRAVLLAPPNQGSSVARTLNAYAPARWLLGPSLGDLARPGWGERLPLPLPFAIVAGTNNGLWLFDGEGDGLVSVEETLLAGSARHLSVDAGHTFIMDADQVRTFVTGFIAGE